MKFDNLLTQGYDALAAGGQLEEAKLCFQNCLSIQANNPAALTGWGVVQRALGHPDLALKAFHQAIIGTPDFVDAWAQLGTTWRVLNELKASGETLERALVLDPSHSYARANLEVLNSLRHRDECVFLDYRPRPKVRYGYGQPQHSRLAEVLAAETATYHDYARSLADLADAMAELPKCMDPEQPERPWWDNIWFPPLDAAMLCVMIAHHRPARLLEIGSGMSTRFARWSIERFSTGTRLESIDPEPRAEIDALCNRVIRQRLEDIDLDVVQTLAGNDIIFFDGSHRSFQNSDVTVFFLEIIPILPSGVIIHIHDIFLPYDYPPNWVGRLYNEQYLLAAMLLANQTRYNILWPGTFVADLLSLNSGSHPTIAERFGDRGGSFWLQVK